MDIITILAYFSCFKKFVNISIVILSILLIGDDRRQMLGKRIKELRTANKISQVELAKKLSVSKQSVSNWENGNIMPSIDMLLKISRLFSVSTDYLLGLEETIHLDIDGLSTEKLAFLQRMIAYLQQDE